MKKIFSLHCILLFLMISCSVNAQKSPALVNMSLTKPEKAILYTGVDNVLMLKGEVPGKYLQIERSNGPVEWKGGTQLRAVVRYETPGTDTFRVYAGEKVIIEKIFEIKPLGILKAGLKGTRDTLLSATELAAITGLELTMGDDDGEISGQCDGQPGIVDYYEIQYTTVDPNGPSPNWQHADTSKKSRFELTGLPSGQKVWVRLRAVNATGKSGWCDPACKRVP